jgi:hypothetical protein
MAALSFVLSQFGWKGSDLKEQTMGIVASHVIEHPTTLRGLISRMILSGTAPNTLSFASPSTGQPNEVFDPQGGQATDERPPSTIGNAKGGPDGTVKGVWGYKDITDPLLGYYIKGVGKDDDVFGRDIIAYLHDISETVCKEINIGYSITGIPQQDNAVNYAQNGGKGYPSYSPSYNNVFDAAPGQQFACVEDANGSHVYDYYHVLLDR